MASNLWVESYLELLMCNEALPTLGSAGAVVASPSSSTGRATPDRELGSSVGRAAADLELSPEQVSSPHWPFDASSRCRSQDAAPPPHTLAALTLATPPGKRALKLLRATHP